MQDWLLRLSRSKIYVRNKTEERQRKPRRLAKLVGLSVSRCLYWAWLGVLPSSSPATYTLKRISWTSALPLGGPIRREQWLVFGWKPWGNTVGNKKKKKEERDKEDIDIYSEIGNSNSKKRYPEWLKKGNSIYPQAGGAFMKAKISPEEKHHFYIPEVEL